LSYDFSAKNQCKNLKKNVATRQYGPVFSLSFLDVYGGNRRQLLDRPVDAPPMSVPILTSNPISKKSFSFLSNNSHELGKKRVGDTVAGAKNKD
jgi:hypothetical protein